MPKDSPLIIDAEPASRTVFREPPVRDFLGSSIPSSDLVPVEAEGPPAPTAEDFKAPQGNPRHLSPECRRAIMAFRLEHGGGAGELLSQNATARALGLQTSVLGQLLADSYPGKASTYETRIMAALAVRGLEVRTTVAPFGGVVSDRIARLLKTAVQSRIALALVGPAGCGKSSALDFLATQTDWGTTLLLRARRGLIASRRQLAEQLWTATGKHRLKKSQNLYTELAEHFRGRPAAVVLDQADEARADAVQFLLSLHAETGVPLVLVGRGAFALELKAGAFGPLPGGLRWNRISFDDKRLEPRRCEIIDQLAAAHWPAAVVGPVAAEEIRTLSHRLPGTDFASLVSLWDATKRRLANAAAKARRDGRESTLSLAAALDEAGVEVLARIDSERLAKLVK